MPAGSKVLTANPYIKVYETQALEEECRDSLKVSAKCCLRFSPQVEQK
jgi:hypothetical protein